MKFLLTGAEVTNLGDSYMVIYKNRILKNKLKHEEAIGIALNLQLLEELYRGKHCGSLYN